jgi:ubiquinone/menaquinone biosynthesis C-methylase UbiE
MNRPGAFKITDKAMEICRLPKGAQFLEIGCGEGETTERLERHYGYQVSAIDLSLKMVDIAKKRGLNAKISLGDGEFLDEYTSKTFDGVIMECVLSRINLPDEALHEAYCVLKDGGKLVISDLYLKNPDPGMVLALDIEAKRMAKIPHEASSCSDDCADEHKQRLVNFRYEGVFLLESLKQALREMNFTVLAVEDYSDELDSYVAECIFEGKEYLTREPVPKGTGYFLLVAQKGRKDSKNE